MEDRLMKKQESTETGQENRDKESPEPSYNKRKHPHLSVTLSEASLPFLTGFDRTELKPFPKNTRNVSTKEQEILEEALHTMEGTFCA